MSVEPTARAHGSWGGLSLKAPSGVVPNNMPFGIMTEPWIATLRPCSAQLAELRSGVCRLGAALQLSGAVQAEAHDMAAQLAPDWCGTLMS